jgi:CDGSH-type Zn-finger protein
MSGTDGPRIRVTKDGPYLVEGALPMAKQTIVTDEKGESVAWRESESVEPRSPSSLCRCGASTRKPYCDGAHTRIGFDGTETAPHTPYAEAAMEIEGPTLVLMDGVDLCVRARYCAAKGKIWHRISDADDDSRRVVIEQSEMCPAGRYTAVDGDTKDVYEPELDQSIGLVEDPQAAVSGPLWVRGGVPVISTEGEPYEVRNRVTLCRCGASERRPPVGRSDELDRELDKGSVEELPPAVPGGFLGERAPDMRKVEEFRPSVTGGLVQESTPETRWMTIALLYLLIVTVPVAAWLVWRDPRRSLGVKLVITALGIAGYVGLYMLYSLPQVR